jgi:hypothetical protein
MNGPVVVPFAKQGKAEYTKVYGEKDTRPITETWRPNVNLLLIPTESLRMTLSFTIRIFPINV